MGRLWQCDWCGAIWNTRDAVALIDVEFGGEIDRKIFACPTHLPPGTFPAADTDPLPEIEPVLSADEAEQVGLAPP